MTDAEAQVLYACVEEVLYSEQGLGFDVGNPKHFEQLIASVRASVPVAGQYDDDELSVVIAMCWLGPGGVGIPPVDLREELLGILRQTLSEGEERLSRVMEFVVAYGCGKWRQVQPGKNGWEQRWPGAMRGLVRGLQPAVEQSNRWLTQHVVGFPKDRGRTLDDAFPEDTPLWSDAWLLGQRLIRPEHPMQLEDGEMLTLEGLAEEEQTSTISGVEWRLSESQEEGQEGQGEQEGIVPPGAKMVWQVVAGDSPLAFSHGATLPLDPETLVIVLARDEDAIVKAVAAGKKEARLKATQTTHSDGPLALAVWECTCGTTYCQERHQLRSWEPDQQVKKKEKESGLTLWDFVASAVKGPQPNIQTGSFVAGMYFSLLASEGCEL